MSKGEIERAIEESAKQKEKIGVVSFYFLKLKYPIKSVIAGELSFRNKEEIIVLAVGEKDKVTLSARTQNKEADMSTLLKTATEGFEDSGAGGHKPASGGHIQKKDLEKFKENLKRYKI